MTKVKEALICENDLQKAAEVLRAINHKIRLEILYMLQIQRKLSVTAIYEKLDIEQSVVSQHLAVLRKAGIVGAQRQGKMKHYFIEHKRLQEITLHAKALLVKSGF